ncbi:MAG: hypothetical protein EBT22_07760 [Chloroflexi bacterium]|nr:hypothetical protein [Chloroflexota bacterium]
MSVTNGLVTSVQVGIPEPLETSRGVVPSSICRRVLSGRVPVTSLGLAGNEQADMVNHGGADKAVCVYFSHHYSHWESRLGFGLTQGAFASISGSFQLARFGPGLKWFWRHASTQNSPSRLPIG